MSAEEIIRRADVMRVAQATNIAKRDNVGRRLIDLLADVDDVGASISKTIKQLGQEYVQQYGNGMTEEKTCGVICEWLLRFQAENVVEEQASGNERVWVLTNLGHEFHDVLSGVAPPARNDTECEIEAAPESAAEQPQRDTITAILDHKDLDRAVIFSATERNIDAIRADARYAIGRRRMSGLIETFALEKVERVGLPVVTDGPTRLVMVWLSNPEATPEPSPPSRTCERRNFRPMRSRGRLNRSRNSVIGTENRT